MRQVLFLISFWTLFPQPGSGNPETITPKQDRLSHQMDVQPRTDQLLRDHLKAFRHNPSDDALKFEIGLDYMYLADASRWGFLEQACTFLEQVKAHYGEDPLVLMYLGRSIGARALDPEPQTIKRLKWAREGFKYMDRAVSLDDDDYYLRLLRGEAQLYAHPILRRGSRLDADAQVVKKFAGSSQFEALPDYQKARIHLFLGNYLQKKKKADDEVHDHWQATITLAQNTPLGKEARARLEGTYVHLGYDEK